MIEITNECNPTDVIVTAFEAVNVPLNKRYKLRKRDRRHLLYCFRIFQLQGVSQRKASENLERELRELKPEPSWNFKRYKMFNDILFDVEQILTSNNVEFDLARYLSSVCGIPLKDLASSKRDRFIQRWYRYILAY